MALVDPVSVTALVVSLVALFAATGQLVQQYFATADGYRRCQRSVMGDWASRTRLRWRWREFRFETLYTTPEIYLVRLGPSKDEMEANLLLLGDNEARRRSLTRNHGPYFTSRTVSFAQVSPQGIDAVADELVAWLPLLHWTHLATRTSLICPELPLSKVLDCSYPTPRKHLAGKRIPAVRFQNRSWDFQPPDTVRPLAKTNVSTIAILARRLGMRWKSFRPEEGMMQAEGSHHLMTSTSVRGIGVVLQHVYTGGQSQTTHISARRSSKARVPGDILEEAYVMSSYADDFGFGLVHGDQALKLPDFWVNSEEDIVAAFEKFGDWYGCSDLFESIISEHPRQIFPVGDLVALCSPFLIDGESRACHVPAPGDNMWGMLTTPMQARGTIQKLRAYINDYRDVIAGGLEPFDAIDVDWILKQLAILLRIGEHRATIFPREDLAVLPLNILRDAIKLHEECTMHLNNPKLDFSYQERLGLHMRCLLSCFHSNPELGYGVHLLAGKDDRSGRFLLAAFLDSMLMVEPTAVNSIPSLSVNIVGWILMMMRGLAWGMCHVFTEGERVPAQYYGSQMPVWLA